MWERIYLAEGVAVERRGRGSTGRPKKLPRQVEGDLPAEVQWLRAENEYQKTCRPWYWKTSDASAENTGSSNAEAKTFSGYSSFHRSTAPYNLLLSSEADEPPRLAKAICHENKGRYGYRRIPIELHNRNFF